MKELYEKICAETDGANKVVFVGIGEEKMTDDAVGPFIISQLLQYNNDRFLFINGGVDPMARIDEVVNFKPSHMILIDSCTYNASPGTVVILKRDDIAEYVPISSHTIPVHIVVDLIIQRLSEIKTFMIGIVPESLEGFSELHLFEERDFSSDDISEDIPFFNIQLTDTIQKVADQLIEIIKSLIREL